MNNLNYSAMFIINWIRQWRYQRWMEKYVEEDYQYEQWYYHRQNPKRLENKTPSNVPSNIHPLQVFEKLEHA